MANYYLVQFSDFASNASYIVAYAWWTYGGSPTWSPATSGGTPVAPSGPFDYSTTFAVGIITGTGAPGTLETIKEDATAKELPPPPNAFASSVKDVTDFKGAFKEYLASRG